MLTWMRKRPRPRPVALAGAVTAVLLLFGAGVLVPSPVQPLLRNLIGLGSTPALPAGSIGESQVVDGMVLTVHDAVMLTEVPVLGPAPEGEVYLATDVSIEVADAEAGYCSPSSFQVNDDGGGQYFCATWAPEPVLKAQNLARGERVRGNVAFAVPADAKGLVLVWETLERGHARVRLGP